MTTDPKPPRPILSDVDDLSWSEPPPAPRLAPKPPSPALVPQASVAKPVAKPQPSPQAPAAARPRPPQAPLPPRASAVTAKPRPYVVPPARDRFPTLSGVAPPPATVSAAPKAYDEGNLIADRYELVSLIGKGGFGQVWMAKSRALDSLVAIKLFVRAGADVHSGAERLLAEARAAAQLQHPAIVRVFDFGETSRGDPFLVMELLRGESLADLVERSGPLNPSRLAAILLPVIDALGTAHAKGIIHRDIKPANLFLGKSESRGLKPEATGSVWVQPKVIDFGMVKRDEEGQLRITQEGSLAGSPAYMSPEQVQGETVDARTDIWSLSVVMYELLTGRMPFPVTSQYELFKALVEREPEPILELVDPALVTIVLRGLRKPVDARWSSMRELGIELAKWLESKGVRVDAAGASIRETWLETRAPVSVPAPRMPASPASATRALVDTQDIVNDIDVLLAEPAEAEAAPARNAREMPTLILPDARPARRSRAGVGIAIGALLAIVVGLALFLARGARTEQAPSISRTPTTTVAPPAPVSVTASVTRSIPDPIPFVATPATQASVSPPVTLPPPNTSHVATAATRTAPQPQPRPTAPHPRIAPTAKRDLELGF